MVLPNFRFARAILVRSFTVCVAIRIAVAFIRGPAWPLILPEATFLVVLTVGLVLFDLRRTGEELFLANLGVAPATLALLAAGPPLVFELLVEVLVL